MIIVGGELRSGDYGREERVEVRGERAVGGVVAGFAAGVEPEARLRGGERK